MTAIILRTEFFQVEIVLIFNFFFVVVATISRNHQTHQASSEKRRIVTLKKKKKDICCVKITFVDHVRKTSQPCIRGKKKEIYINLSFNEKLPESAGTWELCDKSLVCLSRFIYGLVLKGEECIDTLYTKSHTDQQSCGKINFVFESPEPVIPPPPTPAPCRPRDPVCFRTPGIQLCVTKPVLLESECSMRQGHMGFLPTSSLPSSPSLGCTRRPPAKRQGGSGTMVSLHRTVSHGAQSGHVTTQELLLSCVVLSLK